MIFEDNIDQLQAVLHKDGLLLIPTAAVWSIATNAHSSKALNRLLRLKEAVSPFPITLLFHDLSMLKKYAPDLHPRIETLLFHFTRPLSIVLPTRSLRISNHIKAYTDTITVRLAQDDLCKTFIEQLDEPIIISSASLSKGWYPRHFNDIEAEVLRNMDYICNHRSNDVGFEPEVIIAHDEMGELTFLRS